MNNRKERKDHKGCKGGFQTRLNYKGAFTNADH